MGALEGAIATIIIKHGNSSIWVIDKGPILGAVFYAVSYFQNVRFFHQFFQIDLPRTEKLEKSSFTIRNDVWMQGVVSSAVTYYIQGVIMEEKGPVFVSSFSPLSMIIVAILSSFLFSEELYLGR